MSTELDNEHEAATFWQAKATKALARIEELERENERLKGTLTTEGKERVRCRDGWAAERERVRRVEVARDWILRRCDFGPPCGRCRYCEAAEQITRALRDEPEELARETWDTRSGGEPEEPKP